MHGAVAIQEPAVCPTAALQPEETPTVTRLVVGLLRAGLETLNTNRAAAKQYFSRACSVLESGPLAPVPDAANDPRAQGGLAPWQAKRVSEYINSNLDKPVRIRDLCGVVRRGPSQFQRAFKQHFGVTPHAFLVKRRVARAQELMLVTDEPLSAIALAVGFCDQAHLTSLFHREVGVTPGVWRRAFATSAEEETMS